MGKTHTSHPEHELELKNYQKPYCCDGCKRIGFGKRYRCEQCDYDLHEDCMFTTPTTSHKFFRNSTFKFYEQHPSNCNNQYWHGIEIYCDACGKRVKGFVYHCPKTKKDLHPCCRNLKDKLEIDGVKFCLSKTVSKCSLCNRKKIKDSWSQINGWSYVSECGKYNFHVHCAMEMVVEGWKDGTADGNDCKDGTTDGNDCKDGTGDGNDCMDGTTDGNDCKDGTGDDNDCLALENQELRSIQVALENLELRSTQVAPLNRNRGSGNKYLSIVKIFLNTTFSVLIGDPTNTLASVLVDLDV